MLETVSFLADITRRVKTQKRSNKLNQRSSKPPSGISISPTLCLFPTDPRNGQVSSCIFLYLPVLLFFTKIAHRTELHPQIRAESCIELRLDLCISFQVSVPITLGTQTLRNLQNVNKIACFQRATMPRNCPETLMQSVPTCLKFPRPHPR